jgi:hypothetical protein
VPESQSHQPVAKRYDISISQVQEIERQEKKVQGTA